MASLFDDLVPFDEPQEIQDDLETQTPEEEEIDTPDQHPDDVDDRVLAIYDYLTESNIIPKTDEFKGSPDELEQLLETLPETMFSSALQEVHEDGQSLLDYAFKLGKDATVENLKKFFQMYVETNQYDLNDEEQAYNYLKDKFSQAKVFKSEDKLVSYLEDLQEEGDLLALAKEKFEEDKALRDAAKAKEIADLQETAKQEKENIQAFYTTINNTVKDLQWDKTRKNAVLQNMHPEEVKRKNDLISKSPMALIQLADIYSRYDETTGQFDLTDYEIKLDAKKTESKKDNILKTKLESSLNKIRTKSDSSEGNQGSFFSQFTKSN